MEGDGGDAADGAMINRWVRRRVLADLVGSLVQRLVVERKLAVQAPRDHLAQRLLLDVLVVAADVVDLVARQLVALLQQHDHCARAVIHVQEGPPAVGAVDLDLLVVPGVADELVHEQVEAHAAGEAVDGCEAHHRHLAGPACALRQVVLDVDLGAGVEGERENGGALVDHLLGLAVDGARGGKDVTLDAVAVAGVGQLDRGLLVDLLGVLRVLLADVLADESRRVEDEVHALQNLIPVGRARVAVDELEAVLHGEEGEGGGAAVHKLVEHLDLKVDRGQGSEHHG